MRWSNKDHAKGMTVSFVFQSPHLESESVPTLQSCTGTCQSSDRSTSCTWSVSMDVFMSRFPGKKKVQCQFFTIVSNRRWGNIFSRKECSFGWLPAVPAKQQNNGFSCTGCFMRHITIARKIANKSSSHWAPNCATLLHSMDFTGKLSL